MALDGPFSKIPFQLTSIYAVGAPSTVNLTNIVPSLLGKWSPIMLSLLAVILCKAAPHDSDAAPQDKSATAITYALHDGSDSSTHSCGMGSLAAK